MVGVYGLLQYRQIKISCWGVQFKKSEFKQALENRKRLCLCRTMLSNMDIQSSECLGILDYKQRIGTLFIMVIISEFSLINHLEGLLYIVLIFRKAMFPKKKFQMF